MINLVDLLDKDRYMIHEAFMIMIDDEVQIDPMLPTIQESVAILPPTLKPLDAKTITVQKGRAH